MEHLAKTQNNFFTQFGYNSIPEVVQKIRDERRSRDLSRTLKALDADELEFTMIVPSQVRDKVRSLGFMNSHQTQRTRGFGQLKGRAAMEASFSNLSASEFAAIPDEVKPKYGFLRPKLTSDITANLWEVYGDDVYTFKKQAIEYRTTYTIGDSLNSYSYEYESRQSMKMRTEKWLKGEVNSPKSWDLAFMPFKYKELISVYAMIEPRNHWRVVSESNALDSRMNWTIADDYKIKRVANNPAYIELQYWGQVNLDHVKSFTFTRRPPAGEFLQALKLRNIKIYDARSRDYLLDQKKIKIWNEHVDPSAVFLDPLTFRTGELSSKKWVKDRSGSNWLLKKDDKHPELQSSADVIASNIYSFFGYKTPVVQKVIVNGQYYSATKEMSERNQYTDLANQNLAEIRQLRIFAAYLNDVGRLSNLEGNVHLSDGTIALVDFSGTLGAGFNGSYKKGKVISDAIGSFSSKEADIYKSFLLNLPEDHPWSHLTKNDIKQVYQKLLKLDDLTILKIVKKAVYTSKDDYLYMIQTLIDRRDKLLSELKTHLD